jgi:signal transduction histidine kinase
VITFATGTYSFPMPEPYPCRLNFRGWRIETIAGALHSGFESLNDRNLLVESGSGSCWAINSIFQGGCMLRNGLVRIASPFRGWNHPQGESGPAAELQKTLEESRKVDEKEPSGSGQTDFRAMAVHDMKSSLILIGGFIRRLTAEPLAIDDERQRSYLRIIKKEGLKLETLLDDFLACTELAGELRLELRPTCLARELRDICESHQLRAGRRNITLRLKCPVQLEPIPADRMRLQRVFGNLLDNALKFSPPESTISVRIRGWKSEVHIAFMDEGPGIDDSDLPYLFEARYRGRTGVETEGSGLGLASVKAVVEAHGGRVLAKNRPEKGAVFTVVLPARQ